ncbi:hypothetical protein BDD39_001562 [Saccharococcus thermophilus]|jgi:hypothetical protein|uniref:Uncharacterized protein n=1 Tax=Saccharococcus thermophilus TaxID=29396 RepID=A0A846MEI2_9BACL|nr:hypothetical protein [Saccharococcus thermophilus]
MFFHKGKDKPCQREKFLFRISLANQAVFRYNESKLIISQETRRDHACMVGESLSCLPWSLFVFLP